MKKLILFLLLGFISFSTMFNSTLLLNNDISTVSYQEIINSTVLQLGLRAWYKAHKEDPSLKPILTIIDFSKPDNVSRLWVIDVNTHQVLFNTLVAHGINSGDIYARHFSNQNGSKESSIGVFKTLHTYYGHAGLSLQINGLEPGYNSNVLSRLIVVHGADYVNSSYMGHSWGCFALSRVMAPLIINTIKDNSLIFAYYPDQTYLNTSRFLN